MMIKKHLPTTARQVARYWLISTVIFFALLMFYTSSPVFGAQVGTPTPDVKTVPPLELLATPTNTAFPTVTPVAVVTLVATAIPAATNAVPTSVAPLPTATRQSSAEPDNNDDENTPSGGGSNPAAPANTSDSQPASPAPVLAAPGSVFTGTVGSVVLNLRKNPSGEQSPIGTLFRGDIVQILGRTADGLWWLICCSTEARLSGWVSAASIQPSFASRQAATRLPIMAGQTAALGASAAVTNTRPAISNIAALQVEMRPSPAFAWQGQTVAIQLVITNRSPVTATNIQLRDHLPPTLLYAKSVVGNQGQLQTQASAEGGTIINLAWPRLAPGASVMATITVQIAPNAAADSLIDNLALVTADQQADVSVGITLAMPPTVLPQFNGQ